LRKLLINKKKQIVVLARVINDREQVWLTALGISRLVKLLLHDGPDREHIIIQSASYLASLAHSRAGLTDGMVACDAIDILCDHLLMEKSEQVRMASAVTLGYLTYNRTASRLLLHNCRNVTYLYDEIIHTLGKKGKISTQFTQSYQTALQLGLPKLLINTKVYKNHLVPREEFKGKKINITNLIHNIYKDSNFSSMYIRFL
jgi:hypothetical protein